MKTTKIITITMLLAALAMGCKKDNNGRLTLVAENMRGDNPKVLVDPANPATSTGWINDEPINLNGTVYYVSGDLTDGFYLSNAGSEVTALSEDMYALYLGADFGGNDVEVTNDGSTHEIVMNKLVIDLQSDGQHMAFPMAAVADANTNLLLFRHLCAGFQVTLTANSAVNDVTSLKIVAQGNSATDMNVDLLGCSARWAVQGPSVPTGNVGGNSGDVDVKYISEMNFDFTSAPTINATGIQFLVPITISSVENLTVIGYDANGIEKFRKTKAFGSAIVVERNRMYTIPSIAIN